MRRGSKMMGEVRVIKRDENFAYPWQVGSESSEPRSIPWFPAMALPYEMIGCQSIDPFECAGELELTGIAQFVGCFLHEQTRLEQEFCGAVHFEAGEELIWRYPPEAPENSREV